MLSVLVHFADRMEVWGAWEDHVVLKRGGRTIDIELDPGFWDAISFPALVCYHSGPQ